MREKTNSKVLQRLLALIAVVLATWVVAQALRQRGPKRSLAVPTGWVNGRVIVGPDVDRPGDLLGRPLGVAIDEAADELYVADYKRDIVAVFDSHGRLKRTIGRTGQGPGEFLQPVDVDLAAGRLYVLEAGNYRVSILNPHGDYLASFQVGPLSADQRIAVSSDGKRIYLNEPTPMSGKLFGVYDEGGTVLQRFGDLLEAQDGSGRFETNTVCFDLDPDGNLYVFHRYSPVVRKYDRNGHLVYLGTLEIGERDDKSQDWKQLLEENPMGGLVQFVSDIFIHSNGRIYLVTPPSRRQCREFGRPTVILYQLDPLCHPVRRMLWRVPQPIMQTDLDGLCVSKFGKIFGTMGYASALVELDTETVERSPGEVR